MSEIPPPPPPPPPSDPPPGGIPPPPDMVPPGGQASGYTPPPAMPPPGYSPGAGYQPRTDGMAITALVLGIAAFPGICCYGIPAIGLGIAAVILGRMALRRVRASGGTLGGEGLAQAGWICGLVAGAIGAIYLIFIAGTLIFAVSNGAFSPTPTP
jgi:hypothetical protein